MRVIKTKSRRRKRGTRRSSAGVPGASRGRLAIGPLRLLLTLPAVVLVTLTLLPLQSVSVWRRWPSARWIPVLYHRALCFLIGVRIAQNGTLSPQRPLLIVSNHISWLDIPVLTACAPVAFVAKREIATWPVFGRLARLQRSVFVDRERRLASRTTSREIAERMLAGDAVVLFAEGTSSDGTDVLPFRSALIGAAAAALAEGRGGAVFIQPLAISYPGPSREHAAWYGDMDLLPHLLSVLRQGAIEAAVHWGEPIAFTRDSDRKDAARRLEQAVRALKRGDGAAPDGG